MKEKLTELIKYGSESASLDFKETQYPIERHEKKNEILKDISAMANHPSDETKFIIIGVIEANGIAVGFHEIIDLVDEAKYQQLINAILTLKLTSNTNLSCMKGFNWRILESSIIKTDRIYSRRI